MTTERIDLRGAEATLLMTLYLRDRDARAPRPVLGDHYASEVVRRVDHDFDSLARLAYDTVTITARARCFDAWTSEFLAEHPDGQVLHLGCGLDSRPLRLRRPETSRWIDVDFPDVIELRQRLYDLPADVETIPSSVTDAAWWDLVSHDRPTLVLGEGLFMYLDGDDVHALIDRALRVCPSGQLAFDGVAPWTIAVSNRTREFRRAGARFRWGYEARAFEARHPALKPLDDRTVTSLGAVAAAHPLWRGCYRAMDAVPLLRDGMRLHRYGFGS